MLKLGTLVASHGIFWINKYYLAVMEDLAVVLLDIINLSELARFEEINCNQKNTAQVVFSLDGTGWEIMGTSVRFIDMSDFSLIHTDDLEPRIGGSRAYIGDRFGFSSSGRWLMVSYDLYGVGQQNSSISEPTPKPHQPSRAFNNLFIAYAHAFNKTTGRTGILVERPFHLKLITSDTYF